MNFKPFASVCAGAVGAFLEPIAAPATLCTVMVLLDCGSAVMLSRRLRRKGLGAEGRLCSRRLGRVITTLTKVYIALIVSTMGQQWVVQDYGGFDLVRFTAAAISFWQLLSILENESTCSDARWARIARKYLVDKAKRHL